MSIFWNDEILNGDYDNYNDIANDIYGDVIDFQETVDNERLKFDPYQTAEQYKRDKDITRLLSEYVDNYASKSKNNRDYRKHILYFTLTIIGILCFALILLIWVSALTDNDNITLYIGSFVSLVGLPIGVLKVITEYVFPKDEEKYINRIVKSIQKNDLENKQTIIEAQSKQEKDK